MNQTQRIKQFAREIGFDLVGVAPASLDERHGVSLRRWLADGFHADMEYMARDPQRRGDVTRVMPAARSVVSLALNYYRRPDAEPAEPSGKVSKYAYGADYHKVIEKKLKRLARFIREELGGEAKTYVDTGPVLERAYAQSAGLGFIGKNANLITREYGSWVFLASVITDLELDADAPSTAFCGTCRICIDACPTQAIVEAGRIDARKCISYLTIESKSPIPEELAPKMGQWVFGCDVCQDVCPYNHREKESSEPGFSRPIAGSFLSLSLEALTEDDFRNKFSGSPVKRAKRSGLIRNIQSASARVAPR